MKYLFVVLGITGAIAPFTPSLAQTPQVEPRAGQQSGRSLLVTPVELNQPESLKQTASPLTPNQLTNIANSIQAHPAQQKSENSVIPNSLIPRNLIRTPSKPLSDTHPLEMFQPPVPNRSFGINLNQF